MSTILKQKAVALFTEWLEANQQCEECLNAALRIASRWEESGSFSILQPFSSTSGAFYSNSTPFIQSHGILFEFGHIVENTTNHSWDSLNHAMRVFWSRLKTFLKLGTLVDRALQDLLSDESIVRFVKHPVEFGDSLFYLSHMIDTIRALRETVGQETELKRAFGVNNKREFEGLLEATHDRIQNALTLWMSYSLMANKPQLLSNVHVYLKLDIPC